MESLTRRDWLIKTISVASLGLSFGGLVRAASDYTAARGGILGYLESADLPELSSNVIMVDFAPETPRAGIIADGWPDNEAVMRRVLADKHKDFWQLVDEYGLDVFDGQKLITHLVRDKQPELALALAAAYYYTNGHTHGEKGAWMMHRVWQELGVRGEVHLIPLQKLFERKSVVFTKDSDDNPHLLVHTAAERMIGEIKRVKDRLGGLIVISLGIQLGWQSVSLQIGEDGKIIPLFVEAYDQRWPREIYLGNVHEALKVAWAFPHELVFLAAGDYSSDLRTARQEFADCWPANAVFTASAHDSQAAQPMRAVHGADLYIKVVEPYSEFGWGSSFSTPLTAAVAVFLEHYGLPPAETLRVLNSFVETGAIDYSGRAPQPDATGRIQWPSIRVFDPRGLGRVAAWTIYQRGQ